MIFPYSLPRTSYEHLEEPGRNSGHLLPKTLPAANSSFAFKSGIPWKRRRKGISGTPHPVVLTIGLPQLLHLCDYEIPGSVCSLKARKIPSNKSIARTITALPEYITRTTYWFLVWNKVYKPYVRQPYSQRILPHRPYKP